MSKTISRTIDDIVIGDINVVQIQGPLDDPVNMSVTAVANLRDDNTGEVFENLSFSVSPNFGTLTALSNILKTSILADANAALQARGSADPEIPPP